jgi:serine/threonine protein kinase/pimeloyl-ACP methyl ester carboxylesterase
MIGQTISHYQILEQLGAGGMGVVYKARDTKLDRMVALKFLPHHAEPSKEQKKRFVQEAKSISALDHPNICTIYEIDETDDGQMFIAMGYYAGQSLAERLDRGPLPVGTAIDIAVQVARGLSKAHASGVIHRDIKPANIIITEDNEIKIVDFGLAKLLDRTRLTREDTTVGTVAYMSPEQAQGSDVDHRADLWALGVVLYEMLIAKAPFAAEHEQAVLYRIINDTIPAPSSIRRGLPPSLDEFIAHCLEKSPDARPESADAFAAALDEVRSSSHVAATKPTSHRRGRRLAMMLVGVAAIIAILGWIGSQFFRQDSGEAEVRANLFSEVRQLIGSDKTTEAYFLLNSEKQIVAGDPALVELVNQCSREVMVDSDPSGAAVYFKDYLDITGEWVLLGTTPVREKRLPISYLRLRFEKDGYQTREIAARGFWPTIRTELIEQKDANEGMTYIPEGQVQLGAADPIELPAFWMDKYEVTNRAYQEFVDAGGYRDAKYWKQPFYLEGRTLPWEEAITLFEDATGRPGPPQWELGRYPEGTADHPVEGVSWYEAAAYVEFVGKELPTVYHWRLAAGLTEAAIDGEILLLSNFESEGPAAAGAFLGLSPFGNYDMAGNVQEWCWNEVSGRRYSLGGDWDGPSYAFMDLDNRAQMPITRLPTLGFRGMKTMEPYPTVVLDDIENPVVDYATEQPVGDDLYAVYKESYAYDRTDLEARIESTVESEHWRKEKISFKAAYGQERVPAYLFLPRGVEPPYQTVIYFPGGGARTVSSSEFLMDAPYWEFVIRSGRAVLYPVYQNTYERRLGITDPGPNRKREIITQWGKDIQRAIDYLETRPDIDSDKLAYYSLSLGSTYGGIFTAIEPRFRCSILMAGGLFPLQWPPDVLPINFLPRSKVPTLMINGKYDFGLPVETSVKPMLDWMGAPDEDKKLYLFDGDHIPPANEIVRVTLDWLDRYLGAPR